MLDMIPETDLDDSMQKDDSPTKFFARQASPEDLIISFVTDEYYMGDDVTSSTDDSFLKIFFLDWPRLGERIQFTQHSESLYRRTYL